MFLETISAFGNDVLVPINRIKYISMKYVTAWEIHIVSDNGDWIECFDDNDKANKRYQLIKNIIKAK